MKKKRKRYAKEKPGASKQESATGKDLSPDANGGLDALHSDEQNLSALNQLARIEIPRPRETSEEKATGEPRDLASFIREAFAERDATKTAAEREADEKHRVEWIARQASEEKDRKGLARRLGGDWGAPLHLVALHFAHERVRRAKGFPQEPITLLYQPPPEVQPSLIATGPAWHLDRFKEAALRMVGEIHHYHALKMRPHSPHGVSEGEVWLALLDLPPDRRPPGEVEDVFESVCRALEALEKEQRLTKNMATGDLRFLPLDARTGRSAANIGSVTEEKPAAAPSEDSGGEKMGAGPRPGPPVELLGPDRPVQVLGKEKPAITDAQYAVVAALIAAGDVALPKKELEKIRPSARATLKNLSDSDPDWKSVLQLAGKAHRGYRIVDPSKNS